VAGPERYVEEATLTASGPTALRNSGVAADLRKAVGSSGASVFCDRRRLKSPYNGPGETQENPVKGDR